MTIDYVVPMVFDDDLQWQQEYKSHMHVAEYRTGSACRYRSWGLEPLLVRCIKKFMPFVSTIIIILARESQKKPWMDDDRIRVVYHRDFIPEKYLPVFNSCIIEMFIPYIDGLSEHFIYGNDDMFPLSGMSASDFFARGLPVQHYDVKKFPATMNIFHGKCRDQQRMVAAAFGKELGDDVWMYNGHCLAPLLKSSCLEARERFEKEVTGGITPYRSRTSYNQYLYVLWQYFTGRYVDGRVKSTYLSVKDTKEKICSVLGGAHGVVCVNDNECAGDIGEYAALVRSALNEILMRKEKNEYRIWVSYHKDELIEKYGLSEDEHHTLFATHMDVAGKNINHMNPVYSEMVTMWYVWKNNLKSDYVGFEHYRRHLDIKSMPGKGECQIFRAIDFGSMTIYDQYARCHNAKDMDCVLGILDEKYGKGNPYSAHIKSGHVLIANCCFIMKWHDFLKLCSFLFPLLDDFAAACGISNTCVSEWREKAKKDFRGYRTDYQTRVLSFLAERLISSWISTNMKWTNGINVAFVHYNTPELTSAAIMSLNKRTPGCIVTVFDNSDARPFVNTFSNVSVIDNTRGQIIDFDKMLDDYPDRQVDDRNKSNFGSAKHCKSVDMLMDMIPEGFVLMDSDVLVTKDIKGLVCRDVVCGMKHEKDGVTLFQPFLCWINVPLLKVHGIRYFNGEKMWALSDVFPNNRYDTGAWLYEEVINKGLKWLSVDIWQYIIHLGHGSWRGKNAEKWLNEHKDLYV